MKSAGFHLKSGGFQIERPLARNCNPMFSFVMLVRRCVLLEVKPTQANKLKETRHILIKLKAMS